jgi:hypothetical protein
MRCLRYVVHVINCDIKQNSFNLKFTIILSLFFFNYANIGICIFFYIYAESQEPGFPFFIRIYNMKDGEPGDSRIFIIFKNMSQYLNLISLPQWTDENERFP